MDHIDPLVSLVRATVKANINPPDLLFVIQFHQAIAMHTEPLRSILKWPSLDYGTCLLIVHLLLGLLTVDC